MKTKLKGGAKMKTRKEKNEKVKGLWKTMLERSEKGIKIESLKVERFHGGIGIRFY